MDDSHTVKDLIKTVAEKIGECHDMFTYVRTCGVDVVAALNSVHCRQPDYITYVQYIHMYMCMCMCVVAVYVVCMYMVCMC